MLNKNSIKLKNNLIVVDEHPVVVNETVGGVLRPEEEIKKEKQSRLIRTGVIKLAGTIDTEVIDKLSTSSFKGKIFQQEGLIGQTVLYSVHAVEQPLDVPIEDISKPVLLNLGYIYAFLDDEHDLVQ